MKPNWRSSGKQGHSTAEKKEEGSGTKNASQPVDASPKKDVAKPDTAVTTPETTVTKAEETKVAKAEETKVAKAEETKKPEAKTAALVAPVVPGVPAVSPPVQDVVSGGAQNSLVFLVAGVVLLIVIVGGFMVWSSQRKA